MKKATKTVAFRQLAIYCNIVDNQLFTDAKPTKHGLEDIGRGYFADDAAQVIGTFAQVLAYQVAR